jgi:hypothetical protein
MIGVMVTANTYLPGALQVEDQNPMKNSYLANHCKVMASMIHVEQTTLKSVQEHTCIHSN